MHERHPLRYRCRMKNTFQTRVAAAAVACLFAAPLGHAADDADATARLIAELGLQESKTALRERQGWTAPRKVVVMGADAARLAWMQEAAPGVTLVAPADRAAAVREAADADAVIGDCVADVIQAGPRIRWVQRMYAGVERCIAIPAVVERGIVLTNMQKVAGSVMAEHVLAFLFGLTRGFATYVPAQARGEWADEAVPESRLWEVKGRTMLVVGLGGIGVETARRAHALGMTVIAIRNSGTQGPEYVAEVGLPDKLRPFAARADVIVNTLPLTPETKGLFDGEVFDAAKRGALFINVGRGGTVVTDDLVAALRDGRIGGAGLDVTDPEPLPPDHALWRAPNVIITPHVAAGLEGNEAPRWLLARENLRRYAEGGKLLSEVDVRRGY
jgi:phosphoglycerate dehydrogenase-like enzyme